MAASHGKIIKTAAIKTALAHNFNITYKTETQPQHFLLFPQIPAWQP